MVNSREDGLWQSIKFDKDATSEQVMAWCEELVAKDRSIKPFLLEIQEELDLAQKHIDIASNVIRYLITREIKDRGKK